MLIQERHFALADISASLIDRRIVGKKARGWKAIEAEDKAVSSLADVEGEFAKDAVFGGPARGVRAPVDVKVGLVDVEGVDDEGSAGKMAGRTDDFG